MNLSFEARVVIVTGAGRGIGAAYVRLLRELGAEVVVNDIDEIDGVTHVGDVSEPAFATGLIDNVIEGHGRIDALINNAGNVIWATMPDADLDNIGAHIAVHVNGTFNLVRAAWPHMARAGYGRIVNTTSSGVLGLKGNIGYATAKGAVIGMTRTLALEGAKAGIKVNAIAPAAATRLGGDVEDAAMSPDLVAPMAAYLAHEDCPVTGEIYTAGAGRFARFFIGSTEGALTDDVSGDWAAINDESTYSVPKSLLDWSAQFTQQLGD